VNAWTNQTREADLSGASVRLAEANLATLKARLATATDKDQIRRAIRATEQRIKALRTI